MAICPTCNKHIQRLVNVTSGSYARYGEAQGDKLRYSLNAFCEGYNANKYHCPECGISLFDEDISALQFLKGGDERWIFYRN